MKTVITVTFISILSGVIVMSGALSPAARPQGTATHSLVTKAEYERWRRELSNWGRWGKDDEFGTLNLMPLLKLPPRETGRNSC